jgi:hypothetical protein
VPLPFPAERISVCSETEEFTISAELEIAEKVKDESSVSV